MWDNLSSNIYKVEEFVANDMSCIESKRLILPISESEYNLRDAPSSIISTIAYKVTPPPSAQIGGEKGGVTILGFLGERFFDKC